MSHKKYIKRGSKVFGPYLYTNYRDSHGITHTKYLGKAEDFGVRDADGGAQGAAGFSEPTAPGKNIFLFVFLALAVLAVFWGIIFFSFFSGLTGRASLDVAGSYIYGENLSGVLNLNLREGELIPADSRMIVSIGGEVREFLISDLVGVNANGSFYAENFDLSGSGAGYGFAGSKTGYPEVSFVLIASGNISAGIGEGGAGENETTEQPAGGGEGAEENQTSEEGGNETAGGGEGNAVGGAVENQTSEAPASESPVETPVEETQNQQTETQTPVTEETPITEQPATETPATEEQTPIEEVPAEISSITGGAVLDGGKAIYGKASKGSDFVYALNEGESAELESGSVSSGGEILDDIVISVAVSGNEARVSTEYSISEKGFGKEYLGAERNAEINFDNLGILAAAGNLNVKLVYENITLAEASKDISFENVSGRNITEINITEANITLRQYKAVINRPVKWLKLASQGQGLVEIPKDAENITIKTGDEVSLALQDIANSEKQVEETSKNNLMTGNAVYESRKKGIITRFFNWLGLGITGRVIEGSDAEGNVFETSDSKIVDVSGAGSGEIAVEYTTPAPTSVETETGNGKRIIISSGEYNYTNILAYTTVPNLIRNENNKSIRLYHYVWVSNANVSEVNFTEEVNATEEIEVIEPEANATLNETVTNVSEEVNVNESNVTGGGGNGSGNASLTNREEKAAEKEVKSEEKAAEKENKTEEKEIRKGITGKAVLRGENVSGEVNVSATINETLVNVSENPLTGEGNDNSVGSVNETGGYWMREEIGFDAYDLDEEGMIDYVEWNIPHLSEQIYEIIYITKAEHLDENYTFIEDVYDSVRALDGNYTTIPDSHYLRVTFAQNLTNKKDITIYAKDSRIANGTIVIGNETIPLEVYEKKKRIDEIREEINLKGGINL